MFIIAGIYRHQRLISPKSNQTRPTANRLRETFFNICQQEIKGSKFLDIFAGSGAIGLEALSRGAESATFIESHKEAIQCIEKNIEHLKVQDRCLILKADVFVALKRLEQQNKTFDVIYADPPYHTFAPHTSSFYSEQIIDWIDKHELLSPGGFLFIEEAFQSQPQVKNLKRLSLKNSRRIGDTALQQYISLRTVCE